MLSVADTYDRLGPRVRDLAGLLHEDPDLVAVGACARFHGVDHEVRLERVGDGPLNLKVRAGGAHVYRGPLAQWYGAVEKSRRHGRRAA